MKKLTIIFALLPFWIGVASTAYSMSTIKDWANNIRPGIFPEEQKVETPKEKVEKKPLYTEGDLKVLTSLTEREKMIKRREEAIQRQEKELKTLEQQIERKLDQMRQLQGRLEGERKNRKELDEKDISKIVRFYESMDPENSSVFFNEMDRLTATHILMRMNPRKASNLLQRLEPKVAVEITELVTRFKQNQQESAERR